MIKSVVIIPTYNEKENIGRMLRTVFSLSEGFEVLVVDDGSPDGTSAIVKGMQQEFEGSLHILERSGKQGLGTAYIHGFEWALERGYDYIFEMDADFSHDPNDLGRLLSACADQGGDMSIGSRYCKGGKVENWPFTRWMMSYFASFYVRTVLWMNIKDTTAGFKCYSRKVLEAIDLNEIRFVGYAFQIEMKYTAYKLGFKIVEVPITFKDRELGQSKMSMSIFKEAFLGVFKMRKR
ncbi:MAG: dolichyl-phosphate beta-D-mannosyltransferase [Crocinitomicaceae bacterium]|nr:dolichyl-phosphate beta-D-mannosyltransferase [Crocinitomicaceae bacterium]